MKTINALLALLLLAGILGLSAAPVGADQSDESEVPARDELLGIVD